MLKGLSIHNCLLFFFILLQSINTSVAALSVGNSGTVFTLTAGASFSQLGQTQSFVPLALFRGQETKR